MNKIISWILSVVMLILSFFGIGTGNTGDMTKGDWLNEMCATLGLEVAEDATAADACLEWGIIAENDMNDLDEAADATFVFGTLKAAATKLGVDYAKLTKAAIEKGYLAATDKLAGDAKDAADAYYGILGILKDLADNKEVEDKDANINVNDNVTTVNGTVNGNIVVAPVGTELAVGDVFTVPQTSGNLAGGIYEVVSVKEKTEE